MKLQSVSEEDGSCLFNQLRRPEVLMTPRISAGSPSFVTTSEFPTCEGDGTFPPNTGVNEMESSAASTPDLTPTWEHSEAKVGGDEALRSIASLHGSAISDRCGERRIPLGSSIIAYPASKECAS
eukprot:CAMPEP_0169176230 /NCGR_PEP_ID=MMETSP1015-20121227/65727_1 /TAXON_ID=342587 /ORGANISM="Karlodinium micrum, Strain CCMP2283" /LENGTH=124 /DNA_ID=CAMNT_0009250659 /DNA_START=228 /DNA_END=602 /DNA_ORIENTATION=-